MRTSKPYVQLDPAVIEQARQMNLLTYLRHIQDCVADGTIFESAEYHNAVFVDKDKSGTPKYAACCSTRGRSFMETVNPLPWLL